MSWPRSCTWICSLAAPRSALGEVGGHAADPLHLLADPRRELLLGERRALSWASCLT